MEDERHSSDRQVVTGRSYTQEQSPQLERGTTGHLLFPAVISLPTTYRGLTRGLCGNYDRDQSNELMLPSGVLTSNVHVYGNSWEVKAQHAFFRFPR